MNGGEVLGESLPTWLTVIEVPTLAAACITYKDHQNKGTNQQKVISRHYGS